MEEGTIMNQNLKYIQGLRFFGFFIVMATHFISSVQASLFSYWNPQQHIIGYLLAPFTGKVGVAIFCCISGFLAGYVVINRERIDIGDTIIKRYLKFIINILIVKMYYSLFACVCIPNLELIRYIKMKTRFQNICWMLFF